jgi:hypothetical protein
MASEPKPRAIPPGTLVFKTRDDARVSDTKPAVARKLDPVCDDDDGAGISAAAAAHATAKTPEASPYPWWDWVSRNLEYRQNFMRDVIGQVIASERRDTRAALAQEVGAIKRELTVLLHEQITECARALREETREETKAAREQLERDDASMRRELELSKRELTVLREEVALERGLRSEVEEERAQVPKLQHLNGTDAPAARTQRDQGQAHSIAVGLVDHRLPCGRAAQGEGGGQGNVNRSGV